LNGEIVGINTAKSSASNVEGIGFAIPSETFVTVSQQLIKLGKVRWPYLGVNFGELTPTTAARLGVQAYSGVLLSSVGKGTPAADAGLQSGDIILSFDGAPTKDIQSLLKLLRFSHSIGDKVTLTVSRGGQQITLQVVLGDRSASA
jgi:serine protease Do